MLVDNPAIFNKKKKISNSVLEKVKFNPSNTYALHLAQANEDGLLVIDDDQTFANWVSNVYMVDDGERVENIMFFDTETAHKNGYVVSFAAVLYSLKTRTVLKKVYQEFNPGISIDPETTAIHGITDEDVKDAPSFETFAENVKKAFEWADLIVAHNPMYDINVLSLEFERIGKEISFPPFLDTMRRLKTVVQAKNSAGHLKDPRLEECAEFLGIQKDSNALHNALYDTELLSTVFDKALDL